MDKVGGIQLCIALDTILLTIWGWKWSPLALLDAQAQTWMSSCDMGTDGDWALGGTWVVEEREMFEAEIK